jgi:Uma2 family endonuclease
MSPTPNRYHQDISQNLAFLVLKFLERHPIGKLYHAPFDGYLDQYNVFQPDILFVAKERLAILTVASAEGAPNLVIEISFPAHRYPRQGIQTQGLCSAGRRGALDFGPRQEDRSAVRLQEDPAEPEAVYGLRQSFGSVCLPGLKLRVRDIFRE